MATCNFCGQEFSNRQAVRAHLKACAAYLGTVPRQTALPKANATLSDSHHNVESFDPPESAFDPVQKIRQNVAAEKLRLQLREIQSAHSEFDAREEAAKRASADQRSRDLKAFQSQERAKEEARAKSHAETQRRQHAAAQRRAHTMQRREIIQDIKNTVVEQWPVRWQISAPLHAEMLLAIEAKLLPLSVLELPKAELTQIAEGVRDQILRASLDIQAAAQQREANRLQLQNYGKSYAEEELQTIEGLTLDDRWRIEALVNDDLRELTGDEARADVRDRVESIFFEEGLGYDEDDESED